MLEGKLLRGAHAQAGCLGGHMPVNYRGRLCSCGNIGCAEAEAAGWSLPGIVRDHPDFARARWPGWRRSTFARCLMRPMPTMPWRWMFDSIAGSVVGGRSGVDSCL